jgi:hypothetical protein
MLSGIWLSAISYRLFGSEISYHIKLFFKPFFEKLQFLTFARQILTSWRSQLLPKLKADS